MDWALSTRRSLLSKKDDRESAEGLPRDMPPPIPGTCKRQWAGIGWLGKEVVAVSAGSAQLQQLMQCSAAGRTSCAWGNLSTTVHWG